MDIHRGSTSERTADGQITGSCSCGGLQFTGPWDEWVFNWYDHLGSYQELVDSEPSYLSTEAVEALERIKNAKS